MTSIILDKSAYSFDASAKTIEFDITGFDINKIKIITDLTNAVVIYCPENGYGFNGTISGNTLSLQYDTSAFSDTDDMRIIYDFSNYSTNDMQETMYEILDRLAVLGNARGTLADIRVTPLSTPNMATLTTLTNMTQMGGYFITPVPQNSQNNVCVVSNINNVVG